MEKIPGSSALNKIKRSEYDEGETEPKLLELEGTSNVIIRRVPLSELSKTFGFPPEAVASPEAAAKAIKCLFDEVHSQQLCVPVLVFVDRRGEKDSKNGETEIVIAAERVNPDVAYPEHGQEGFEEFRTAYLALCRKLVGYYALKYQDGTRFLIDLLPPYLNEAPTWNRNQSVFGSLISDATSRFYLVDVDPYTSTKKSSFPPIIEELRKCFNSAKNRLECEIPARAELDALNKKVEQDRVAHPEWFLLSDEE